MPRIDAPTVAEHHRQRRASLLAAGRALLADGGAEAVTPAAVGAAAGIARSSVYQYFSSSSELLAAIVEEAFESAAARINAALEGLTAARDRLDAYVRVAFELGTGAEHRMFDAIDPAGLPADTRERVDALHRDQLAPLASAIRDAGAADPHLAAALVGGMLTAAARAVALGADPDATLEGLIRAVHEGPVPERP
ncbi:TetR/AcrR family transcriptional regulator [Demequina gelatinilytica]|uniref:TetR/AcrR family transcriptional regulator n=1 Tax=Demequina gelatinilytica TaxID=1638980 RepID=UPI00078324D5|nr:TetR family transcriptional regulator [Demequina gelatinilytica]